MPDTKANTMDAWRVFEFHVGDIRLCRDRKLELRDQRKYVDFIDIYADLSDAERQRFQRDYPQENQSTTTSFDRPFEQRGIERGIQAGEAAMLLRTIERKLGPVPAANRQRITETDAETLLAWSDRILSAGSLDEVLV